MKKLTVLFLMIMSLGISSQDSLIYKVEKFRIDNAARIFLKNEICQKEALNLHEQILILNDIILSKDNLLKLKYEQVLKLNKIDLNNQAIIKEKDLEIKASRREIRKQKILKIIYPIIAVVVLVGSYFGMSSGGMPYE